MKGVILAGGLGSRLYPLTHITNKHLLPIFDQPMIFYPIQTLAQAGVKEVLIVTGGPYAGHFLRVLKNGKDLGLDHLEYAFQEGEGGIAAALSFADISPAVRDFKKGAMVFLKKVSDPQRFGVPVFNQNDPSKIIRIEEKPQNPKSNYAVTGLYIYDNQVFNIIKTLKPSSRGELEITDVNNYYLRKGKMRWSELKGFWSDAGTFESLFYSNQYWKMSTTFSMSL